MLPSQQELSDLLALLYDAAAEPALWSPFIEQIARHTHSSSAALVMQVFDPELYSMSHSWAVPDETIRDYERYYHALDIWAKVVVPRRSEYPSGTVCAAESLCSLPELRKTEFYNDQLLRGGIEHAILALVENTESCVASVCVYRDRSGTAFEESDLDLLRFLTPHLQRGFNLYRRFGELKSQKDGVENALDTLATGVVFVDSEARIIYTNRSATALLAEKDGLLARCDGLHAERGIESTALRRMVDAATSTLNGTGLCAGGTVLISRRTRPPLQIQISPIGNSSAAIFQKVAAVVYINDPARQQRPSEALLRNVYGLTPAECRIGLLMSDGHAPRAIAEMVGVAENTVRSQIKAVYSKTGVKRQAELMRLLLNARPAT